jgi:hypothetical protein
VLLSGTVVADSARRELLIVDLATPNYQALLDDLTSHSDPGRQIETVIIGPDDDGVSLFLVNIGKLIPA